MKIEEGNEQRHPYEKPRLRTIELTAPEVLAGNCKQSALATGPTGQCAGGFTRCVNGNQLGS